MGSKARPESNGSKVVPCVRCKGDIQPYAGRSVALIRGAYAHHPGQCADQASREATVHELSGQGSLFGWRCDHIEPGDVTGYVCRETGTVRGEYESHMRTVHGKRPLSGTAGIRLRRPPPAASLPRLEVSPFKWLRWTERTYSEWQPGKGQELLSERQRRGQFWAAGNDPHSVWVLPYDGERKPVLVYLGADGLVTWDWSEAKYSRRDANRAAKRYGTAA